MKKYEEVERWPIEKIEEFLDKKRFELVELTTRNLMTGHKVGKIDPEPLIKEIKTLSEIIKRKQHA